MTWVVRRFTQAGNRAYLERDGEWALSPKRAWRFDKRDAAHLANGEQPYKAKVVRLVPAKVRVPKWPESAAAPANEQQLMSEVCGLLNAVWSAYDRFGHTPNDCICPEGAYSGTPSWRNGGHALRWLQELVSNALEARK